MLRPSAAGASGSSRTITSRSSACSCERNHRAAARRPHGVHARLGGLLHQVRHFLALGVEDPQVGKPAARGRVDVAVERDGQNALLLGRAAIDLLGEAERLRLGGHARQRTAQQQAADADTSVRATVILHPPSFLAAGQRRAVLQVDKRAAEDQHSQDDEGDDAIELFELARGRRTGPSSHHGEQGQPHVANRPDVLPDAGDNQPQGEHRPEDRHAAGLRTRHVSDTGTC